MVELGQNILKTSDHGLLYLELLSPLKIFSNIYYTSYLYISAGKEIDCFDCNSHTDPRCGDPFVFTAHTRDMPPVKQCEGCCVKLVQHRGTEYESVRRTCTDEIDINLFMVDHVCMTEGGGLIQYYFLIISHKNILLRQRWDYVFLWRKSMQWRLKISIRCSIPYIYVNIHFLDK